jgi:hypothetical protein
MGSMAERKLKFGDEEWHVRERGEVLTRSGPIIFNAGWPAESRV